MSNYGQTFTKGVKYLKIHKLDKDGEDYGKRLAIADNIRINYPDVGPTQYNILTIQQIEDSYLMGVIPQETTSSLNNIKDYSMVLDLPSVGPTIGTGTKLEQWHGGSYGNGYTMNAISGNDENAYDDDDGIFTFSTPNVLTSITSSISTGNLGGGTPLWFPALIRTEKAGDFDRGLTNESGMYPLGPPITLNANFTTFTTETILSNIPGGSYYFVAVFISTISWQVFDLGVEVNQTSPSYTSDSVLINITPEILNFEYSDYNAVFGNATIPQYSQKYQNVSYNTGLLSPTNIEYIRNGTAEKASINDSNYSQKAWSNSRYNGNRISSYDFNVTNKNSNS
jgi:hypothetical protein